VDRTTSAHFALSPWRQEPSNHSGFFAWRIGRDYELFRHQLGTNARGAWPTKFNGGNFTVDPEFTQPELRLSPDYRAWGGGEFTAQNQRLVHWPMLKSGDSDLMRPQLDFYRRLRRTAELRTQHYWGHKGACFVEQIENFGLCCGQEWGWQRTWNKLATRIAAMAVAVIGPMPGIVISRRATSSSRARRTISFSSAAIRSSSPASMSTTIANIGRAASGSVSPISPPSSRSASIAR
jgi:hypothetical protein